MLLNVIRQIESPALLVQEASRKEFDDVEYLVYASWLRQNL